MRTVRGASEAVSPPSAGPSPERAAPPCDVGLGAGEVGMHAVTVQAQADLDRAQVVRGDLDVGVADLLVGHPADGIADVLVEVATLQIGGRSRHRVDRFGAGQAERRVGRANACQQVAGGRRAIGVVATERLDDVTSQGDDIGQGGGDLAGGQVGGEGEQVLQRRLGGRIGYGRGGRRCGIGCRCVGGGCRQQGVGWREARAALTQHRVRRRGERGGRGVGRQWRRNGIDWHCSACRRHGGRCR